MFGARPSAAAENIHAARNPSTDGHPAFSQLRAFRAVPNVRIEPPEVLQNWPGDVWPYEGNIRFVLWTMVALADRHGVVRVHGRTERRGRVPRLYEVIKSQTGLHRTTIRRCLQALEHLGYLERWAGQRHWNVEYIVRLGQEPSQAVGDAQLSARALQLLMELERELEHVGEVPRV